MNFSQHRIRGEDCHSPFDQTSKFPVGVSMVLIPSAEKGNPDAANDEDAVFAGVRPFLSIPPAGGGCWLLFDDPKIIRAEIFKIARCASSTELEDVVVWRDETRRQGYDNDVATAQLAGF
jgi:hypothetical protein